MRSLSRSLPPDATLLPIGVPKGYGLALVVDVLAGVLTGSDYGVYLPSVHDLSCRAPVGFVVLAVDITVFIDWAGYEVDVQFLSVEIRRCPRPEHRSHFPAQRERVAQLVRAQAVRDSSADQRAPAVAGPGC